MESFLKIARTIRDGLAILIILAAGAYLVNKLTEPISFDSEKWKNQVESEANWSVRWDMMNSLRKNYELKGMTKSEVIELLGEPSQKYNSTFSYDLGSSKRGINYGYLELTFNEKGIVSNFVVGDH